MVYVYVYLLDPSCLRIYIEMLVFLVTLGSGFCSDGSMRDAHIHM